MKVISSLGERDCYVTSKSGTGLLFTTRGRLAPHMAKFTRFLLRYFTEECLLDWHPNSAEVILARTFITSTVIFVFALVLKNCTHLDFAVCGWPAALFRHTSENVPWLGAIAAAVYAAFYTRFAAQWSYLAKLYNQIKQSEVSSVLAGPSVDKIRGEELDDWRVAFIDDAGTLHLCAKRCFASIIVAWAERPYMKKRFAKGMPDEALRFDRIVLRAQAALPPGFTVSKCDSREGEP